MKQFDHFKILYIKDLDGTLLNSKSELSSYSESKMTHLINQNVNISIYFYHPTNSIP